MKTVIITENERGFLTVNGKFSKMLGAGKYRICGNKEIEVVAISAKAISLKSKIPQALLAQDPDFAAQTTAIECKNGEYLFHFVNGVFQELITQAGTHYFWAQYDTHTFESEDPTKVYISEKFLPYISYIPGMYYERANVFEREKGLLYINHKFERILEPGCYFYWSAYTQTIRAERYPDGLVKKDVVGQEILTADKVSLRINCVCNYRITDFLALGKEIGENYEELLHDCVQLALREYVGKHTIDQILESKQEMSEYLSAAVVEKGKQLHLAIEQVAVKDIILPGEVRDIMNTVLIAEKKAQASVIARREEVASTRSLLNTARLMEENETLYKLKEMEYVERICEKVGNINLNGGEGLLTQLTATLLGKK